jgi:hypothetical protein
MMKIFAGILGILGGLLGLVTFSGYLLDGYFLNGFFLGGWRIATGGNPRWASWAGSPRSPVSPRASRFSRASVGGQASACSWQVLSTWSSAPSSARSSAVC